MLIASIDHVVLTVADMQATIDFYTRVLGMTLETFGQGRKALKFGEQKFNLQDGKSKTDIVAVARTPTPGSVDLCLLTTVPLDQVIAHLKRENVPIDRRPGGAHRGPFSLALGLHPRPRRQPDRDLRAGGRLTALTPIRHARARPGSTRVPIAPPAPGTPAFAGVTIGACIIQIGYPYAEIGSVTW